MLLLLALLSGWLAGLPGWAGAVQQLRLRGDGAVLTLSRPAAQAGALMLAPRSAGDARIILDLARPAITSRGALTPDRRTLALAVHAVDDARLARAAADRRIALLPPFAYFRRAEPEPYSVTLPVPRRVAPATLPRVAGEAGLPLVVLDPGHGGHDPGALSPDGTLREKDVTLALALAVRDALLESGKVRVALTREDDRFLILQERYGLARALKGDLFVSIHCDSAADAGARGATIYTLSEVASDKEAARLAARENRADILGGAGAGDPASDISSILIDLTQRETMARSADFARLLGREAQPLIPTRADPHRMASLVVLKAPDLPSVLFEAGYLSNTDDAGFLASAEGRARVASAVRRAVEIHFATRLAARRQAPAL